MSTPNFYTKNVDTVYAVFPDEYSDIKDDYIIPIQDELFELDKRYKKYDYYKDNSYDGNRSYCGRFIGELRLNKQFKFEKELINISIKPLVRNGYYEGINFDYEIDIQDNYGGEYDENELPKYIQKEIGIMRKRIEKIFEKYCEDELVCVAIFSNGEAIYQRAKE